MKIITNFQTLVSLFYFLQTSYSHNEVRNKDFLEFMNYIPNNSFIIQMK